MTFWPSARARSRRADEAAQLAVGDDAHRPRRRLRPVDLLAAVDEALRPVALREAAEDDVGEAGRYVEQRGQIAREVLAQAPQTIELLLALGGLVVVSSEQVELGRRRVVAVGGGTRAVGPLQRSSRSAPRAFALPPVSSSVDALTLHGLHRVDEVRQLGGERLLALLVADLAAQLAELLEPMRVQREQPEQGDEERDRRRLEALEHQHALQADDRGDLARVADAVANVGPHVDLERQRRRPCRCLSLGLEEREEAREHVAGVVVDVLVDELLGRGRVGPEQEPRVRALLALDLLAERARALDHDAVEQLAGDARRRSSAGGWPLWMAARTAACCAVSRFSCSLR
jgi:hypothetical protein